MKTYSILGCGWLGLPLAKHLLIKGAKVKGSTTSANKLDVLKKENIIPYLINIENIEEDINVDFFKADVLIIMITSKNIEAFEQLMHQIEKSDIKKIIFISSTSVYDACNCEVTENYPTNNNPLATIENLFRKNNYFKTTILRFAGLIGGKRHPGNWFESKPIPQPEGFVNMIHRDDCIAIITKIIEKNMYDETFNACVNHHPTRREFYTNAKQALFKSVPVFKNEETLVYKIINTDKLINTLKYQFIHQDLLDFSTI
ncbi:NAD(P)-binding domain-containing protein [Tenacibaculum sp. IB213877]|uniref:NAD(P)-binding domain-containing protein n=1 Tax=Tenacibaculum sp. IB213877 TaxID=3097351 RepID=UPI002A5A1310|nr:NAD(P)-binding domain-containing protein [Tenacibaculum sp. IB213877]MDY0781549.1 NAD(P)-binding domain-containing protein [Tenacibaculum sp. IB213877]